MPVEAPVPSSSGEVGAGMPTKCDPPSVVRTIEVHTGLVHGASPSSQYSLGETAVNDTGSKPLGTVPPAGTVVTAGTVVGGRSWSAAAAGAEVEVVAALSAASRPVLPHAPTSSRDAQQGHKRGQ